MTRLSREEYFMRIAEATALRSTCPKQSTGAIVIYNRTILATGYNGPPPGWAHCEDLGGCVLTSEGRCYRSVHAEANALVRLPRNLGDKGNLKSELQLFTTHTPCYQCYLLAISAGVGTIYFRHWYEDQYRDKFFEIDIGRQPVLISLETI